MHFKQAGSNIKQNVCTLPWGHTHVTVSAGLSESISSGKDSRAAHISFKPGMYDLLQWLHVCTLTCRCFGTGYFMNNHLLSLSVRVRKPLFYRSGNDGPQRFRRGWHLVSLKPVWTRSGGRLTLASSSEGNLVWNWHTVPLV